MFAKRLPAFVFTFVYAWGTCFSALASARAEGESHVAGTANYTMLVFGGLLLFAGLTLSVLSRARRNGK